MPNSRILTFGTFDGFHPGHVAYLSEAATYGELFVVIARDANVLRIKGRLPDRTESERMQAVQEAFPDAKVFLGDAEDFLRPIRDVRPDRIVLGYDQTLPPGIEKADLPCPVMVASAYKPEEHKSSRYRRMEH